MLIIFEGKKVFCLFSSTELKFLIQENFFGFVSKLIISLMYFLHMMILPLARLSIRANCGASRCVSTDGKIISRALFCIVSSLSDKIPGIDCHTGTAYSKTGRIIVIIDKPLRYLMTQRQLFEKFATNRVFYKPF